MELDRSEIVLAISYALGRTSLSAKEVREVFKEINKFNPKLGLELTTLLPTKPQDERTIN